MRSDAATLRGRPTILPGLRERKRGARRGKLGSRRKIDHPVALYSLVHRASGPVATYATEEEAQRDLEAVLRDEPDWADDLYIEPIEFAVAEVEPFARRVTQPG